MVQPTDSPKLAGIARSSVRTLPPSAQYECGEPTKEANEDPPKHFLLRAARLETSIFLEGQGLLKTMHMDGSKSITLPLKATI